MSLLLLFVGLPSESPSASTEIEPSRVYVVEIETRLCTVTIEARLYTVGIESMEYVVEAETRLYTPPTCS